MKIKGYVEEPINIYINGLKESLKINALVLDSTTTHINLGVKDLESNNIILEFNNNETKLHHNSNFVKLQCKAALSTRLSSKHKLLVLEAMNEFITTPEKELSEEDILASALAPSRLTGMLSDQQILLNSGKSYSIQNSLTDAYLTSTSTTENISEHTDDIDSIIEDTLMKITKKNTSEDPFIARVFKATKIPPNSHVFVKVK